MVVLERRAGLATHAKRASDPTGQAEGLLSPYLRERRFRAAAPHLRGRVLDFGCACGAFYPYVRPLSYVGVDADAGALRRARALYPGIRFIQRLPDGSVFDTVACLAVVEHLDDPAALFRMAHQHLVPGGRIILTTPAPGFRWLHEAGAHWGVCSREAAAEHHRFFARGELESLGRTCGFRPLLYRRFLFGLNQLFALVREP